MIATQKHLGFKLGDNEKYKICTQNTNYLLEIENGNHYLSGHPIYCPEKTPVIIRGCTWGGTMIMINYIGLYMYMEFSIQNKVVCTSMIESIECITN